MTSLDRLRDVDVETIEAGLRIRGVAPDGTPVDVSVGGGTTAPLEMRSLLAGQFVALSTPLEHVVLSVEALNGAEDFSCRTLPSGTHVHRYAGPAGAPTLVMLHALGANALTWLPLVELLRGQAHLYCLDLPGHGQTPPMSTSMRSASISAWVAARFDELGVEKAHLVGHSLGGRAAAAFASAHPDRVSSLTLLAPALRPAHDLRARLAMRAGWLLVRLANPGLTRRVTGRLFRSMLIRRDPLNRIFLDYALADLLRDQGHLRYAGMRAGLDWLAHEPTEVFDWRLVTAAVPSQCLFGDGDLFCTPQGHRYLAEEGVDLRVIGSAGHLLPLEDPQACVAAIRAAWDAPFRMP